MVRQLYHKYNNKEKKMVAIVMSTPPISRIPALNARKLFGKAKKTAFLLQIYRQEIATALARATFS